MAKTGRFHPEDAVSWMVPAPQEPILSSSMNAALPLLSEHLRMRYEPAHAVWMLFLPDGVMKLNDSAAEIIRRCDGRHTVQAIVNELEELFETKGIAAQVQTLIDEGTRRGWLV